MFPAVPSSVPAARAWTHRQLTRRGCDQAGAHTAELLVSELTTNAVRHTTTARFTVYLYLAEDTLEIGVQDRDTATLPTTSPSPDTGPDDEGGRGLLVVEALSQVWGVVSTADGKWVWSRLPFTMT